MGLNTKLATADPDNHLVLNDHRGAGSSLALLRVAVFDAPHDIAGLRVERHQRRVGLVEEDLAVAVGDAAIDCVATHHGNDGRILLWLVFPKYPPVVVKVESEHVVRERGM